jgi:hypothetical protein
MTYNFCKLDALGIAEPVGDLVYAQVIAIVAQRISALLGCSVEMVDRAHADEKDRELALVLSCDTLHGAYHVLNLSTVQTSYK